jgi:hypothetical protein
MLQAWNCWSISVYELLRKNLKAYKSHWRIRVGEWRVAVKKGVELERCGENRECAGAII